MNDKMSDFLRSAAVHWAKPGEDAGYLEQEGEGPAAKVAE